MLHACLLDKASTYLSWEQWTRGYGIEGAHTACAISTNQPRPRVAKHVASRRQQWRPTGPSDTTSHVAFFFPIRSYFILSHSKEWRVDAKGGASDNFLKSAGSKVAYLNFILFLEKINYICIRIWRKLAHSANSPQRIFPNSSSGTIFEDPTQTIYKDVHSFQCPYPYYY